MVQPCAIGAEPGMSGQQTEYPTACGQRFECPGQNGRKRGRQPVAVHPQNRRARRQVGDRHHGHQDRGCPRDALPAPIQDRQQQETGQNPNQHRRCRTDGLHRLSNRAALGSRAAPQRGKDTTYRKHLRQPGQTGAACQIDHWPTERRAVRYLKAHRKQQFGVFGRHAEKGGQQHVKHRSRPTEGDRNRDACQIAHPQRPAQRGTKRLQRRESAAFALRLPAQQARQTPDLYQAGLDGQINACAQDEQHSKRAPKGIADVGEQFHGNPPVYCCVCPKAGRYAGRLVFADGVCYTEPINRRRLGR